MELSIAVSGAGLAALKIDVERQFRFAVAVAMTRTVENASKAVKREIGKVFDNPTRYARNAPAHISANFKERPIEARVFLKTGENGGTPASKFLGPQIKGGERGLKRFEKALQVVGLLPAGMYAMPGKGAVLNRYGNINKGQIGKIITALRSQTAAGEDGGATKRKRRGRRSKVQYFAAGPDSKLQAGVYKRDAAGLRPVIVYTKDPFYKTRLDFFGTVEREVTRSFPREFSSAIRGAIRDARPL